MKPSSDLQTMTDLLTRGNIKFNLTHYPEGVERGFPMEGGKTLQIIRFHHQLLIPPKAGRREPTMFFYFNEREELFEHEVY